ncbi:MarR family winged helix-turn-helix transcriptional regulator [Bacillus testis]|uniref:MarR family winged helix-turn-helix transcriptional regulator n=1 Tax=Bacillus testis TaxID=1622072 RepID=UPI00067E6E5A|nr:MarR family transcriptional regulator [Bacillus testis]
MENYISKPIVLTHLKMIEHLAKRFGDEHLKQIDLTKSQADVIILLEHESNRVFRQRDIERALNYSNPTVTGLLNRLEQKGFIVRRVDSDDSRARIISLTDKALEIIGDIYQSIQQTEQILLDGFSEEEIQTLQPLITRMAKNALRHV